MTWLGWVPEAVKECAIALAVGLLLLFGGYFRGAGDERDKIEAEQAKAEVATLELQRVKDAKLGNEVGAIAIEFNKQIETANNRASVAFAELGRLRVTANVASVPTTTAYSAATSGATAVERSGTVEVDFDDVAKEVIQLGADYDRVASQVIALDTLVEQYRKACRVE